MGRRSSKPDDTRAGLAPRPITRRRVLQMGAMGMVSATFSVLGTACGGRPVRGKNWAWVVPKDVQSLDESKRLFDRMRRHGIEGALVQGDPERMAKLSPVARDAGVELQCWIISLCCRDEEVQKNHPDWFMISRKGDSSLEKPPYVNYYTWLCPTRPEVQEYMARRVADLADIQGLAGVHLDYIRYPDVILPVGIQPKYNLVQDREYPEFDFCYCPVCREQFRKEAGVDPLELKDPSASEAWRKFRWDRVTNLVNNLVKVAHGKGKKLTAAVFPSPSIARRLVRQDWPSWNLDAFHPMMYHKYYNQGIDWIGRVTEEGRAALSDRVPLYSGLAVYMLEPEELARATQIALDAGASGITLFHAGHMSDRYWKQLNRALRS